MLIKELPPNHFNTIVRGIKRIEQDKLLQLSVMISKTMRRLRRRSRPNMVIQGIPEGSDHFDSGSFFTWLNRVEKTDAAAVTQVVILDATVQNRLAG